MKKIIVIFILLTSSFVSANEEVLIEDQNLISQLNSIQSSLDNIASKVMACLDSGNEHSKCLCNNKDKISSFNQQVLVFFNKNEALRKLDIVRFKTSEGEWVTQSLQGILKQASAGTPTCT